MSLMTEPIVMRGEIWWVGFDPAIGGEIKKTRPAIIVSNDAANKYLNRVQAVPVTSNIEKLYPGETYVTIQDRQSKAKADQITTISKSRLRSRIGALSSGEMTLLESAIKQQLDL
jgi:mRNA interferase MazF